MAKRRGIASITAEQAQNVLTYLVHEGRITAKAVERALGQREKLIREIRDRMAALGGAAAEGFRQAEKASRRPRRKAASAATRAYPEDVTLTPAFGEGEMNWITRGDMLILRASSE